MNESKNGYILGTNVQLSNVGYNSMKYPNFLSLQVIPSSLDCFLLFVH